MRDVRHLAVLGYILLALALSGCLRRGDELAPIITIVDPPSGAVRRVENLRVLGYAFDDQGVASIKVNGNDLLTYPTFQGEKNKKLIEFEFRITPDRDRFASTIVATDTSGAVTDYTYELKIDTLLPSVELQEVTPLSGGRVRVRGVARDNDLVKSITIADQTLAFVAVSEKEFSLDVDAAPDATVVVEDRAGNTVSRPLTP
ncbi:hypothetical protein BH24DEI2_BH24DEI2_17760 [soil metagenome]